MDDVPPPTAAEASAALGAAEAARVAAARPARSLPSWYPLASGLLLAAGIGVLGLQWALPTMTWKLEATLELAAALLVGTHCVLSQRYERRPGIIQISPRSVTPRALIGAYVGVLVMAAAAALLWHLAGFVIVAGLCGGLVNCLVLRRERRRGAAS
ncbi:hypothetical protein GTY41_16515 [Streptomyces sp. SID685]|uniref:hypothetical protein n=1 Tax=Streptomyces sp. SID685 TaxID=2690322 RepID=UPI00136A2D02|nr:hypothetical protein [Streptomyces sp. SID685]MYR86494.1 hypothetical protein [Streptomyces sp. SID685]